ncbi:hypothetical protein CEXT_255811 [Caerostris extrusa]|uniref:Uncharacterized protein n=1 Tax=Caerostris extrusa TaxID=172846 RepID=A0AAV4TH97_CAEEX|nr:hypothetical protein CEXT_255811 [Caerostris extrusa]
MTSSITMTTAGNKVNDFSLWYMGHKTEDTNTVKLFKCHFGRPSNDVAFNDSRAVMTTLFPRVTQIEDGTFILITVTVACDLSE